MRTSLPRRQQPVPTLLSLSTGQQWLVLAFQRIRYGRIFRLTVVSGQPVVCRLRWRRTVRVSGDSRPHPAVSRGDFVLKAEVVEFLAQLAALGASEVTDIEIYDGLPRSFSVEESLPE